MSLKSALCVALALGALVAGLVFVLGGGSGSSPPIQAAPRSPLEARVLSYVKERGLVAHGPACSLQWTEYAVSNPKSVRRQYWCSVQNDSPLGDHPTAVVEYGVITQQLADGNWRLDIQRGVLELAAAWKLAAFVSNRGLWVQAPDIRCTEKGVHRYRCSTFWPRGPQLRTTVVLLANGQWKF